jgi:hypothetical protein
LYWGDLHSHCSVSYGEGTVAQALARARGQLDFCSITGHAFWPDIPADRERYGTIIDYHREGFARLAENWLSLLRQLDDATTPGKFVALPSFEWHSLKYGDHNVYTRGPELPLHSEPDLPALQEWCRRNDAIAVPHHIGYAAGYRGIDWRHFAEDVSPVVEIFSLHGCSESDDAPYPMLHDMGPRDWGSTAEAGWDAALRFGVIASTDHHGGYPGSHGDGRLAVFAPELTREAIFSAIRARRVYAVTGDKIDARFHVDDAPIGSVIDSDKTRHLKLAVRGSDALDRVEVLKNGRVHRRLFPQDCEAGHSSPVAPRPESSASRSDAATLDAAKPYRLRVTWGWGRKDEPVPWRVRLSLSDGEITDVETCFAGQSIVAPKGVGGHERSADATDLPHEVTGRDARSCEWRSVTTGNISTRHPTTQAISFGLTAPPTAMLTVEANGRRFMHPLRMVHRSRSHYLRGWLSEAVRVGPLVPLAECVVEAEWTDEPEQDTDIYRARAAQKNGQWAWLTPIWVER